MSNDHDAKLATMAVHEDFRQILEGHGYGFQYAVVERARHLAGTGKSPWRYEVEEFPVRVQDRTTHIDFLLSNANWPAVLVAECKRCDPRSVRFGTL